MIIRIIFLFFFTLSILGAHFSMTAYAQGMEDRSALDDIFNPKDPNEDNTPKTPSSMANDYYKSCVSKESLAFNDFEKELLCSCTSAKMTEIFGVNDYQHLGSPSMKGKDTRSKYLAYAYAPCMKYPIESKVKDDCRASPRMANIRFGKDRICGCTVEMFQLFLKEVAQDIFKQAQVREPRTLNPLEFYITKTRAYSSRVDKFVGDCIYKNGTSQSLKAKREEKPISGY